MGMESSMQEPSQGQLAQDYLTAYAEYKEISDQRMNDLKVLDKLRDENAPQKMIEEQQKLFDSTKDEEKVAMDRYVEIGNKLTPETKEKYLK
jgi:hypothetical protein